MSIKKLWNHVIEVKDRFVTRKKIVYSLSRKERGEVQEFIEEHLSKEYIRLSKLPQTALVL